MKASQMRQLAKVTELMTASEHDKAAKLLHKMITSCADNNDMYLLHTFAQHVGYANHPLFKQGV